MFDRVIEAALAKAGSSKALADEIKKSQSEISRFISGEIGLKITHLQKLFDASGLILMSKKEKEGLINTIMTLANLYQDKK